MDNTTEQKIRSLERQISSLELRFSKFRRSMSVLGNKSEYDYLRMLSDEKYRIEIAIEKTNTDQEAKDLLGISERTFYRKKKKYNL